MPAKRFIFRYRGKGTVPLPKAQEAIIAGGMKIVDSSGRMILVEGEQAQQTILQAKLSDWSANEEKLYAAPKPVTPMLKHKIRGRK